MQKRKKSRGSRLFLLFLLFGCTMVGYCGYRWGKDFWTLFRRNAALKFYNVVLETYIPEVVVTESDHRPSLYEDAAAILFPSFSYHEQQLWCDSQAEQREADRQGQDQQKTDRQGMDRQETDRQEAKQRARKRREAMPEKRRAARPAQASSVRSRSRWRSTGKN